MLPPATVAEVLEVPEAELEQMKIAGCIYSWESADERQIAEARITSISVTDDAAKARQRFDNSTKNQTAEELRAQLGSVMKATKGSEDIDTTAKKQAVDQVGGMVGAMVPDGGYQFEDVAGIGDAARVLQHDSTLHVLVGNMVFTVAAYKGAAPPPPDMSGVPMTDMDQVIAAAAKTELAQLELTRDARKRDAIAVAKAIVAGL